MSSENIVKLDIGGTVFKTSKSTLTKFDGMFKTMLETSVPVKKDESGSIFIDRSPKHFELILNFMRDGEVELPDSEKELKEIQKEAQYYLLYELMELCNSKMATSLRYVDSDEKMLQIIINSKEKPVLIIFYPIHTPHGYIPYPDDFCAKSFLEKYKTQLNIYFKPIDNSIWIWSIHKESKMHGGRMFEEGRPFTEAIEYTINYFFRYILSP